MKKKYQNGAWKAFFLMLTLKQRVKSKKLQEKIRLRMTHFILWWSQSLKFLKKVDFCLVISGFFQILSYLWLKMPKSRLRIGMGLGMGLGIVLGLGMGLGLGIELGMGLGMEITRQKSTFFKKFKLLPYNRIKWVILSLIYSWSFFDLTLRLRVSIKKSAFQAPFHYSFFMGHLHNVLKA